MNDDVEPAPAHPIATFLLFLGITLYATVSSSLLVTLGVPYDIPGGLFLAKIHPGTYVLGLAYLAVLLPGNPVRMLFSDMAQYPAWLFYGFVVILLIVYSALMFGTAEAAFVPETLLMPLIVAGLLSHLRPVTRARAFLWTIVLLTVNSAIAIGEGVTQAHLVPYLIDGKPAHEEVFRATALGGHPLANALVTVTYMFAATLLLRRHKVLGVLVILLFGLALLAFGGRVAFAVSALVGSLWLFVHLIRIVPDPEMGVTQKLGAVILSVFVLAAGVALTLATDLGGRIFHGFQMDASARSRFALFDVFSLIDGIEFLFGVGPIGIEQLMRTLRFTSGLSSTIENFWVLWVLNFGVVGFLAVTVSLFWFFRTLLRRAPTAIWLTALVFLIAASGNNSLGAKNKGLAYLVIAIMGGGAFAAREAGRDRPRSRESSVGGSTLAVTLCLSALAGTLALGTPAAAAAEVPDPALKRGVNLSHWLQYGGRQPVVAADLAAIRARGFDHVRIPFDPAQFGWRPGRDGASGADWRRLDRAMSTALDAGLNVILDFHPKSEQKEAIERDAAVQAAYVALWREFAVRYRAIPADRLVFELLNEPQFDRGGKAAANGLKRRTIAAIRGVDPSRVLLLASMDANRILDQLAANELFRDRRLYYVFHFYSPHIFTHFGATWGSHSRPPYTLIDSIRYPAARMDRGAMDVREGTGRERALRVLGDYIERRWDAARLEAEIGEIAAWASRNGVRVICTEFGVIRTRVDAESRLNWLKDARTALERHGIPWTVWDYADVFGIAVATGEVTRSRDGAVAPRDKSDPRRRFDEAALDALGLGRL